MRDDRRLIEWGKTLLIAALTVSALWLCYLSPLVQASPLLGLFQVGGTSVSQENTPSSISVTPFRMAVGNGVVRWGVQYDRQEMDEVFAQTAPLLGEGLRTAGPPVVMNEERWQALLSGAGVWFDFLSPLPLSALCGWLQPGGESQLPQNARYLLLAAREDGSVILAYRDEDSGLYYQCATGLDADLHLAPVIQSIPPNGAYFAFENALLSEVVSPYTLLSPQIDSLLVYTASSPDLSPGSDAALQTLSALSFGNPNSAPINGGWVYVDGEDTLRLYEDGRVSYHAGQPGKYPAASASPVGALELSWSMLETLLSEARLYLSGLEPLEEGGWVVTFSYLLDGCPVHLQPEGWAARFVVTGAGVSEFDLYPRVYTATGQTALLLPPEKAAAALSALSEQAGELLVRYLDNGSAASPGWVARHE